MIKMNLFEIVDSAEHNALHRAVRDNNLEAVKLLKKKGVSVVNTINEGQTPLYVAISKNYHEIVEELCQNKSREELRNMINRKSLDTGRTVLQFYAAAQTNSLRSLRFLLSRGAKYDVRDKFYRLPEHLADSDHEYIRELFEGIEVLFKSEYTESILENLNQHPLENHAALLYARNRDNFTTLQVAMSKNNLDIIEEIVHSRIEILKQDDWRPGAKFDEHARLFQSTRLLLSDLSAVGVNVKSRVVDLLRNALEFLEEYRKNWDPSLDNQPALVAIEESLEFFGSCESSKFVENKRLDLLLTNRVEFVITILKLGIVSPMLLFMRSVYTSELLAAVANNDLTSVEKCLCGHPDFNEEDVNGRTALRCAFERGHYEVAILLLTFGVDPTIESTRRQNVPFLLFALKYMKESSQSVDVRVMELLFDRDDEKLFDFVNAKTANGSVTALQWVTNHSHLRLVQFILSRGAIYCTKNSRDLMPKDYCGRHTEMKSLYCEIERLFAHASRGQTKELIPTMEQLDIFNLLAVGGARNEEGQTLAQVCEVKGHVEVAKGIEKLLASDQCTRYKRDLGLFLCEGLDRIVVYSGISFRRDHDVALS